MGADQYCMGSDVQEQELKELLGTLRYTLFLADVICEQPLTLRYTKVP